ncbi:methyltransferase family protein [Mucilaginibacter yixingensis]|uniref:Methyltransferase family protein n=1 Tax=Mucilaginibacter yixingensis TaxID=1295612 RepID=A0A2T5JD62_9SPHI|nr:methyltransferase domain-containing protein [Mucilaginibacter yixingensis]PTQ99708.1 methyltransferase family protein [Mucilaginibacter yixingensis]
MTSLNDSGALFAYHRAMIEKHGNKGTGALGWREPEHQLLRFKELAAIADLNGCTVIDAGCGHADLLPFLLEKYPQMKHYYGIEMMPELLDKATERYGDLPNTTFFSANFMTRALPEAHYILVCGSLNYSSGNPGYIFEAIEKLYKSAGRGLAFNLLRSVSAEGVLRAYNPAVIARFCRTLSKNVVLKDDYADEDFTVLMRR